MWGVSNEKNTMWLPCNGEKNFDDPGDIGLTQTVAKFNKAKIESVYFGMKPMSSVASITKKD